jgi:hypothetical protein
MAEPGEEVGNRILQSLVKMKQSEDKRISVLLNCFIAGLDGSTKQMPAMHDTISIESIQFLRVRPIIYWEVFRYIVLVTSTYLLAFPARGARGLRCTLVGV